MDAKEKRNKQIISMHNDGKTTREIAEAVGVSKTLVNNIIGAFIASLNSKPIAQTPANNETPAAQIAKPKEPVATVTGKRITNFGEYQRLDVNKYAHKSTGEIITVKFVPATAPDQCGHFVTV